MLLLAVVALPMPAISELMTGDEQQTPGGARSEAAPLLHP